MIGIGWANLYYSIIEKQNNINNQQNNNNQRNNNENK